MTWFDDIWVSIIVKIYSWQRLLAVMAAADKSVAHMWKWHWNSWKM